MSTTFLYKSDLDTCPPFLRMDGLLVPRGNPVTHFEIQYLKRSSVGRASGIVPPDKEKPTHLLNCLGGISLDKEPDKLAKLDYSCYYYQDFQTNIKRDYEYHVLLFIPGNQLIHANQI